MLIFINDTAETGYFIIITSDTGILPFQMYIYFFFFYRKENVHVLRHSNYARY